MVSTLLFAMALWEAGSVFAHLDWLALGVALPLYAIPFWVVARASALPKSA
jgi:hypothetical protein